MIFFKHFTLEMLLSPKQRAIFNFPFNDMPPLYKAYFSTYPIQKALEKDTAFRFAISPIFDAGIYIFFS